MIDQCQHTSLACSLSHTLCFICSHRHRLFAKHCLMPIEGGQRDLLVGGRRCDYTDQINVIALNQLAPVVSDVFDAKLPGDSLSMFTMTAGNRDHARVLAIEKAGNLSSAGKAGANN